MTEPDIEDSKKTIIINAGPEVVFRTLINETELTQWFSNERTVLEVLDCGLRDFDNDFSTPSSLHHCQLES